MGDTKMRHAVPFDGVIAVLKGPALKHFVQTPADLAPAEQGAGHHLHRPGAPADSTNLAGERLVPDRSTVSVRK
jgi:hypothetical protein